MFLSFSEIARRVLGPQPKLRYPAEYEILANLDHFHGVLLEDIGYLYTLWEIPADENELEKKFLVEHIAAYLADKEGSVLVPFHKIQDRVLEVAPETSLTGQMDGETISFLIDLKFCIMANNRDFYS